MTSLSPAQHEAISTAALSIPKRGRGRPAKIIANPFYGYLDPTPDSRDAATNWGKYPRWAMDIMEGIARLDWHDRPASSGLIGPSGTIDPTHKEPFGSSKPLSIRKLMGILTDLPTVSAATVTEYLQAGLRQAQRYVKAIELAIPWLMQSRPKELVAEMAGEDLPVKPWMDWEDLDTTPPSPEDLAKLHYDLRTRGDGTVE